MCFVKLRNSYALRAAALAIAAAAFGVPAMAASTTVTADEANVLNLLSPFLNLNATSTGQQTLTANLNQAIATNKAAGNSPVIEAESISEKTIFSAASGSITQVGGTASYYGPGANLAGGLPLQALQNGQSFSGSGNLAATPANGTINAYQQAGGLGSLGGAYQTAVSPTATTAVAGTTNYVTSAGSSAGANSLLTGQYQTQNVVNLLVNAYSYTSTDLGVAKYYFANGTTNGANTAVAPSGYTLPTSSDGAYPNTSTSVYDVAYGVNNTQTNQNTFGDSRPVQVAAGGMNQYDPNAITGLTGNPAFPSGHTTYAFTDSILIAMMVPQFYQSMLLSASEYGNSRIDLGVHYPLDIIASRAFVQYDLAQLLNATSTTSTYGQINNSSTSQWSQTLNGQFVSAAQSLNAYLNTQTGSCGGSLAACAANNSYNTYSATTYAYQAAAEGVTNASASATNAAIYEYRQNYGLPTLSFTAAPRELTDTNGNSAAILLATLYGGSTPQAQALANAVTGGTSGAGIYGNLSTATIDQIIANTETNALAAFYGTQLSYWSRIDLYDAAGYFQNVTGTVTLASKDQINTNVTVGNTGVLGGNGTVNGNVTFQSGGALGAQGNGTTSNSPLTVNGTATFQAGSKVELTGVFLPGKQYTLLSTSGTNAITLDPSVIVDTTTTGTLLQYLSGKLSVVGDPSLVVTLTANLAGAANTPNQKAVATAIDTAANAGTYGSNGATLLNNLISTTVANGPAAFTALSGEGLTGQQQTALNTGNVFVSTVLGQATFWSDGGNDVFGMKDGGSLKDGYEGAVASRARVWASGFGQYATLNGETSNGSANLSSQTSGVVTGVDYQVTQHLLAGIAGGYSSSSFSVDSRATSGTVDGAHFGVYGVERFGNAYVAGTAGYSHYNNTTDRFVTGLGAAQEERGRFSGDEWLARFEGGYKTRVDGVNVTPFAGFQLAELSNNAFSETNVGAAVAGLNVSAQTVDSEKSFVGVQFDNKEVFGNGWVLTPYARLSWEHEFNTDRSIAASLLSLPGSAFTVYGASAASDVARVNAGFKLDVSANVAVFTSFDGEFSDRGNSYTGTGGVKIRW
jgi:outer membrane autotransporter protein